MSLPVKQWQGEFRTLPCAVVRHHSVGRTRLRIAEKACDGGYFAAAAEHLRMFDGVNSVHVNPRLGTILILHHTPLGRLFQRAHSDGVFSIAITHSKLSRSSPAKRFAREVFAITKRLDSALLEASDGSIDLQTVTAVALLGMSAYQVRNGKLLPAGVPLFAQGLSLLNLARNSPD